VSVISSCSARLASSYFDSPVRHSPATSLTSSFRASTCSNFPRAQARALPSNCGRYEREAASRTHCSPPTTLRVSTGVTISSQPICNRTYPISARAFLRRPCDPFWTTLAHLSVTRLNAASLSRSLRIDATTVTRYLDLLVDLLLVRRLAPWHGNVGKRLVKSPKMYVRDTGLIHALLDIPTREALLGHPKLGDSFEGFVIENLLAVAPAGVQPFWCGTGGGAEIDLVLEFPSERWAIEIKHASGPVPSRGFNEGCRDIEAGRRIIVYAGEDCYKVRHGVEIRSLVDVMSELTTLTAQPTAAK